MIQITVKVLSFDKDNEKISLGLKQLTDNPWEQASVKIQGWFKRSKVKSQALPIMACLLKLQKGVEGLVHISEISWTDRITDLA